MRPSLLFLLASAILAAQGCVVHSTRKVAESAALHGLIGGKDQTEVRLIAPDGTSTGWIAASNLVFVGDMICGRSNDPPWRRIAAVRVTGLTDANIAAILVGLPRSIPVRHLGGGEVRLETNGRDLTRWFDSVAHDPSDVGLSRYHALAGDHWRGPLTWAELRHGPEPRAGWPVAGTSAELRSVDVPASVAVSVLATSAILIAAGIAVIAHVPDFLPSGGPRQAGGGSGLADVPLALTDATLRRRRTALSGSWRPLPCEPGTPTGARP
jgi:hypothetical protein